MRRAAAVLPFLFLHLACDRPPAADPDYVRAGGFVADIDRFDPAFFGLSPREAEVMDPQLRVFLQCAWQALEHAGHVPGEGGLRAAVFAVSGTNRYLARSFPGLAAPQKQVVCAGSVLWTILDARWKRLTPDQQEQFRQQYRMAAAMPPPQPAYPAAPSGAGAGLDAIADAEARQRMFEILSDVSLQQHVTSLNIIENMSDSGNYWEIVDY